MANIWSLLAVFILGLAQCVKSANILTLLPTSSASHLIFEMAVVRAMAERQHNITVVSVLPLKTEWLVPGITYIKLTKGQIDTSAILKNNLGKGFINGISVINSIYKTWSEILDDSKMQELIWNNGNHFDLLMVGYFYGDFFFGIAEKFNCPIALLWPNKPNMIILQMIGNPLEMSYTKLSNRIYIPESNLNLSFRMQNIVAMMKEFIIYIMQRSLILQVHEKHFPSSKYASFDKARERLSLVLSSNHFSEKSVRPLVPGLVEIGGIQLNDQPNQLPEDLEKFMQSAGEAGIIYFSFGTNVKAYQLPDNFYQTIYNVFSKLSQKIIWKWNDDDDPRPGNSSNILYRKWLPQADILGHPRTKLFFGHGGKGGITEAKFYGVPIVGFPIFGDQPANMEEVVENEYGLSLDSSQTITEHIINASLTEVLVNPKYAENIKKFSRLYRDRPVKPKDLAIYWLEYIMRYTGAPHMQSPLKTMSLIEAYNLDILIVFIICIYIFLVFIKYIYKNLFKVFCSAPLDVSKTIKIE